MPSSKYSWVLYLLPDDQSFTAIEITKLLMSKDHPEFDRVRSSFGHFPKNKIRAKPNADGGFCGNEWKNCIVDDAFHSPLKGVRDLDHAKKLIILAGSLERSKVSGQINEKRTGWRFRPIMVAAVFFFLSVFAAVYSWENRDENRDFLNNAKPIEPQIFLSGDLQGLNISP